jgi:uncharacterized membrane protein YphA (DoxX/SURF4 family)
MKTNNVWFFARLFVGVIFIYTGFEKLIEPVENFRGVIAEYRMVPHFLVAPAAYAVPWFEFLTGVFLVLGYAARWTAAALGFLSAGFVFLLGGEFLLTGQFPADCGCFGSGTVRLSVPQVFVLDILNVLLCLKLFLIKDHPFSIDRWLQKS